MKQLMRNMVIAAAFSLAVGSIRADLVLFTFESATQGWGSTPATQQTTVTRVEDTHIGGGDWSLRIEITEEPSSVGGAHWGSSQNPLDLTGYSTLTFWTRSSKPNNVAYLAMRDPDMGAAVQQYRFDDQITETNTWSKIEIPLSFYDGVDLSAVSFINYKWATGYTNEEDWEIGDQVDVDTIVLIPEPASFALLLSGAGILLLATRRFSYRG